MLRTCLLISAAAIMLVRLQMACSLAGLHQHVESVASSSAAAVADLSLKMDGLHGDVAQMKELLLALLARQQ